MLLGLKQVKGQHSSDVVLAKLLMNTKHINKPNELTRIASSFQIEVIVIDLLQIKYSLKTVLFLLFCTNTLKSFETCSIKN